MRNTLRLWVHNMITNTNALLKELYRKEQKRLIELSKYRDDGDFLRPVFGEGSLDAVLMLIGEAPGAEEAETGRPFVGKAGKQLSDMLACAGIDREAVFITNAVKYRPIKFKSARPSNRTPTLLEIKAGAELLKSEIELISPKVVATLGNTPLSAVLDLSETDKRLTIGSCHGNIKMICINGKQYQLFPLYHPASTIYNRAITDVLKQDLIKLGRIISDLLLKGDNIANE